MRHKKSSTLAVIRISEWDRMQHYKHRSPPWIKLYSHLLDDPAFCKLSSCDVGVYAKLLLIASRCENRIAYNTRWLRNRYGISAHSIMVCAQAGLITITDALREDDDHGQNQAVEPRGASAALADRLRAASSEERENRERAETKAEQEQERNHDREQGHKHERDLGHEDASKTRTGALVVNASARTAPRSLSRNLPRMPDLRKGKRLTTDFESINDAVEKLIKSGGVAPGDCSALALVAGITEAQAAAAVQQLRDRGRI